MRKLIKIIINNLLRLIQKRPKKLINVNIENADNLFKNKKKYFVETRIISSSLTTVNPKFLEKDNIQHFKPFESIAEITMLTISSNETKFCMNHFLDENSNVLYETGINLYDLPLSYKKLPVPIQLNGSIAYLSNSNVQNYGHWLQYTFPLLSYYWEIIGKDKIDYYYIGDIKLSMFQKESLFKAGIKENQIINYSCKSSLSYVCIKNNSVQHNYAKYNDQNSFKFPRSIFSDYLIENSQSPQKIFIKRGRVNYRKLLNEKELESYFFNKGFVSLSMDNLSIKEQANLFYNAKCIVASHGSSLTNLLFTQPDTLILELFPFGYPDWFNFTYASYAKLNYYYLIGEDLKQKQKPIYTDILIDIKKIELLVESFNITEIID
jgi:hypothetical protein